MKNLSVNQPFAVKKNLFVKLLLLPLVLYSIGVENVWGETYTMYNGSSFNSSWSKSTRTALVSYASKNAVQLMGVNKGVEGEIWSNITFSGVTAISIKATGSNERILTTLYSADGSTWTDLSKTTSITKNTSSYSDYNINITGLPSSAVYLKFRAGGNSIYIQTITITASGSTKTLHFPSHKSGHSFLPNLSFSLCQCSSCNFFKCLTVALYFHCILYFLYYLLFIL